MFLFILLSIAKVLVQKIDYAKVMEMVKVKENGQISRQ